MGGASLGPDCGAEAFRPLRKTAAPLPALQTRRRPRCDAFVRPALVGGTPARAGTL